MPEWGTARTAGRSGRAGGARDPGAFSCYTPRWAIPSSESPETGLSRRFWRAVSRGNPPGQSGSFVGHTASHRGATRPLSSLQTIRTFTADRSFSTACWITPSPSHGRHVGLARSKGA